MVLVIMMLHFVFRDPRDPYPSKRWTKTDDNTGTFLVKRKDEKPEGVDILLLEIDIEIRRHTY